MGQCWYCENDECYREISGDGQRFQCLGCGSWFCIDCSQPFIECGRRVCGMCAGVWMNLCQARGLHSSAGIAREGSTGGLIPRF